MAKWKNICSAWVIDANFIIFFFLFQSSCIEESLRSPFCGCDIDKVSWSICIAISLSRRAGAYGHQHIKISLSDGGTQGKKNCCTLKKYIKSPIFQLLSCSASVRQLGLLIAIQSYPLLFHRQDWIFMVLRVYYVAGESSSTLYTLYMFLQQSTTVYLPAQLSWPG